MTIGGFIFAALFIVLAVIFLIGKDYKLVAGTLFVPLIVSFSQIHWPKRNEQ